MKNVRLSILLLILMPLMTSAIYAQVQSSIIRMNGANKLIYTPYTEKGDIIPDFSYCGYMMGEETIPNVTVVSVSSPTGAEDDTPFIQAKIDSVAELTPDKQGFRGTILLKKGIYRIASPLQINAGGIVLRGEGNDKENGTLLLATSPYKYNVIEIGLKGRRKLINASKKEIYDSYVPSGSNVIHVREAGNTFKIGDNVAIIRPSTAKWIHDIGMDSIPPRPQKGETTLEAFQRFRKEGSRTDMNGTIQWTPNSKNLVFERRVVDISGDKITLDIPLTNALQKEYGGGWIYQYTFSERISHCGIENLYGMTVYDEKIIETDSYCGEYYADENHADIFVACQAVEHAWVKDVSVEHFDRCVSVTPAARFITGQELSAINPISVITGGRRYGFDINGALTLFQRCYARDHRHAFVLGATAAGPNVFVNSKGENLHSSSEPHQRWAAGCLFDNIELSGYNPALVAVNRGNMGTGHGWAGAQMVFWNCSSPLIMVAQPPTAQNFSIGFGGYTPNKFTNKSRETTIRSFNNAGMENFQYKDSPIIGNGWIEFPNQTVIPQSLYYKQLEDRIGTEKVKQIMPETEYKKFF